MTVKLFSDSGSRLGMTVESIHQAALIEPKKSRNKFVPRTYYYSPELEHSHLLA